MTTKLNRYSWCVCLLFICLGSGQMALAQTASGTIYGRVSDANGALVPGATVTIINEGTNAQRAVKTDEEGNYLASLLPIGKYTIRVSQEGFQEGEVKGMVLEIQDKREINLTLQVAGSTASVQVQAEAPLLERTTSALGQVVHQRSIVELPLNGRNFVQLGTLSPGAIKSEGQQFNNPSASTSVRGTTSLSVNGLKENTNDWIIDGVDNNELTAGSIAIMPSIDSIQEFKVLTSNYTAQYGRNGGGTIILTTKSGTNGFHGTAFEFLRNDALDARNFFDGVQKPSFRQNQFGFSLGGPIKKDKLFLFGDYQGTRIRKELTFLSTVPTARARAGDFSEAGQAPVFDPCLTFNAATQTCTTFNTGTRTQFAGNVIPTARLDPIAVKLLNLYPIPNLPGLANNFRFNSKRVVDQNQFDVRVDHNVRDADAYFGRFSFDNAKQFFPGPLPGLGGGVSSFQSATVNTPKARNLGIVENHIFSPTTANQLVLGWNRINITVVGPSFGQDLAKEIGIPGANLGDAFTSGLTRINLSGFNGLGDRLATPLLLGTDVYQVSDNLSTTKGRHSLNFGFALRYQKMNNTAIQAPRGNVTFDQLFTAQRAGAAFQSGTGASVASLLLGLPASLSRSNVFGSEVSRNRWQDYRGYLADEWPVTPSLVLNLGLAYELITPQTDADNRLSYFDPTNGTILVAGVNASKTGDVTTDKNNFQPRIGFAYTPFASRRFVIRGGYGIFNDFAQGGIQGPNPPFVDQPLFSSNSITPARLLREGFPAPVQQDPNHPSGNVNFVDRNFRLGFVQQWNLSFQQELGWSTVITLAYVGSRADRLLAKDGSFNSPPPGAGQINPRRPFPALGSIIAITSRGRSDYNAMQLKAEKRLSSNLYFLIGYTWSKSLGDETGESLTFQPNAIGALFYPFTPQGENSDRGFSSTDLRHSFTLSYVYDLPFGRGQRYLSTLSPALNQLVGGWQFSGITRLRSGFPLGATITPSLLNNTMANRPDRICDGSLPGSERTVTRWFDKSCFTAPAAFAFGNSSRTFGSGPPQTNFDFSIFKRFRIREGSDLQFRTEIFNIFNTPQFDLPSTAIGTPAAGTITATINDARLIQFGLKLIF